MTAAIRRAAALLLAAAIFSVLALRAGEAVAPLSTSLSVLRKFWRASRPTRLLNSRLFRNEPEFGAALIARDRALPLEVDVVLTVSPGLPEAVAEEMRRRAAFVLAPRRVTLARGETGTSPFSIAAAGRAGT